MDSRMKKIALVTAMQSGAAAVSPWFLAGGVSVSNCVQALQPIGAADLATSYVNLVTPGLNDATAPGNAPTFDPSYGWSFTAASQQSINTNIVAAGDNSYSMIVRYTDYSAGVIMGSFSVTYHFIIITRSMITGHGTYSGGAGLATNAPALVTGVYGIAGKTPYRNGVAEPTAIPAGGTATAYYKIYIGAQNNANTIESYATGKVQASAIYNTILTAPQVLAITTRMAALP